MSASSPASLTIERRIEWSDTDASGRWHNTTAFRMVEWAETALLERLGILDEVYRHLPRVHIEADFHAPLDFRDVVHATITVAAVGTTSLTYGFTIDRAGERCVTMTVVTALLQPHDGKRAWTDEQRRLLLESGPQPAETLEVRERPPREREG